MTIGADEKLPTLWQHFMIRHGELPDRHPVELFGEAVVNRIFAGAEDWHWRRLARPALVGLACCMAALGWFSSRTPDGMLLTNFSGAIALLAVMGAIHLARDHRELSALTLQFCAKTEEAHRWLDRLDDHLRDLRDGTIRAVALDPGTEVHQDIPASIFAGNNGRILLLDSRFDETRRAYRKPPKGRIVVSVPGTDATNSPKPLAGSPSLPLETSPPETDSAAPETDTAAPAVVPDISSTADEFPLSAAETSSPAHPVHHLHGLAGEKFEQLLSAYLATKAWDQQHRDEVAAIQRVTHELVQNNPRMTVGAIMRELPQLMLDKYHQKLTLKDESVRKMIGYTNTHRYSEFRNFVIERTDPARRK